MNTINRYAAGAALVMGLGLYGCSEPPYTNIDNAQLQTLLQQGAPLFDIRRPDEWRQTGMVEGSRPLTYVDGAGRVNPDILPSIQAQVAKDAPIVLICRTGNRSGTLARDLAEKGYTRIYNVEDGIVGWIGDRQPVVRY